MAAPVRVTGLDEFVRGMRELERVAPGELNDELTRIATGFLPDIQAKTPIGDGRSGEPGRLKAATKITRVRGKPAFSNGQVYANTIHWGRKTRGVVRATRFIWDTVASKKDVLEREMGAGLNRLLEKHLP